MAPHLRSFRHVKTFSWSNSHRDGVSAASPQRLQPRSTGILTHSLISLPHLAFIGGFGGGFPGSGRSRASEWDVRESRTINHGVFNIPIYSQPEARRLTKMGWLLRYSDSFWDLLAVLSFFADISYASYYASR